MALSSNTKKKKRKKKMMHHNKVVSISQLCFNWAVKTWMLKFKSLKEHKVSCFVDILTFWDLCRVVWWKSPILKFKSQNTTKNACTSAVPCGRRVDGKQCPVLTSRQWTHCISIVPSHCYSPPGAVYWNTPLQICRPCNTSYLSHFLHPRNVWRICS